VVAAEKNGRGIERIRLRRVKDVSAERLLDFIRETVDPGAIILTDGWNGYAGSGGLQASHHSHQRRGRTSSRSHAARS
jgi:transposase-like protein